MLSLVPSDVDTVRHPIRWVVSALAAGLVLVACVFAAGYSVDDGWGALQCGKDAGASQAVNAVDEIAGSSETCLTVRPGSSGVDVLVVWEAPHQDVVQEQKQAVSEAIWTRLPYTIERITLLGIGEGEQAPIVLSRGSLTDANGPQPSELDAGNIALWQQGNVRVGLVIFAVLAVSICGVAVAATPARRRRREKEAAPSFAAVDNQ
jgi:hypothetical protein